MYLELSVHQNLLNSKVLSTKRSLMTKMIIIYIIDKKNKTC